jgi:hypothetical protein
VGDQAQQQAPSQTLSANHMSDSNTLGEFFSSAGRMCGLQKPDLPKMRLDTPLGTPLFLNDQEYHDILSKREEVEKNIELQLLRLNSEESIHEALIPQPVPAKEYCEACCEYFECYLKHISSL